MVEYNPELQKTLKRVSEGKDIGLGALMQNHAQGVAVHSETHWKNHMERFPELADQEPRARREAEFIAKHGGANKTEAFQKFLEFKLLSHDGD